MNEKDKEEITKFVMEQTSYAGRRREALFGKDKIIAAMLSREILDYNTRLMERFVFDKEEK